MAWKTILVPHDFSSSANHATALARDEAKAHGARIVLVHVIDLPHQLGSGVLVIPDANGAPVNVRDFARTGAEAHVEDLCERLRKDGVEATGVVRFGSPIDELMTVADEHQVDLIVMGTHGRTGIRHLIAGSVTERVVRAARVPVLTVRHPS